MLAPDRRDPTGERVLLDLCFTTRDLEAWFCEEDIPAAASPSAESRTAGTSPPECADIVTGQATAAAVGRNKAG